jgi:hypothetical protein
MCVGPSWEVIVIRRDMERMHEEELGIGFEPSNRQHVLTL